MFHYTISLFGDCHRHIFFSPTSCIVQNPYQITLQKINTFFTYVCMCALVTLPSHFKRGFLNLRIINPQKTIIYKYILFPQKYQSHLSLSYSSLGLKGPTIVFLTTARFQRRMDIMAPRMEPAQYTMMCSAFVWPRQLHLRPVASTGLK